MRMWALIGGPDAGQYSIVAIPPQTAFCLGDDLTVQGDRGVEGVPDKAAMLRVCTCIHNSAEDGLPDDEDERGVGRGGGG